MDNASRFLRLFSGLSRAYGTYTVNATRGDKRVGEAFTKHEPVTVELWRRHLDGSLGIGIVPIRDDASAMFGAIDVDSYDLDLVKLVGRVEAAKLPLVVCRSKSGGAHVYCFAAESIPASLMREKLQEVASILGHGNCEIFPKQDKLHSSGDTGSWINMPYFGGIRGLRYAVKTNGDAMELEEFLAFAEARRNERAFFEARASKSEAKWIVDGPPCLEQLVQIKLGEGQRNEGMYNVAVYLKKVYGDALLETKLWEYNAVFCVPPLDADEIRGLVRSVSKKNWRYTCSQKPISLYCNAAVCRGRKYGVSGGESGGFVKLGQLRKLLTEPPSWFWDVSRDSGETATLELTTEQLHSPRLFQIACMNKLNHMPVQASGNVWQRLVDAALSNVVSIEVPSDSASSEGLFWDLLEKFCTGRAQAQSRDEILLEKPWVDDGYVWFKISALLTFLNRSNFKEYRAPDIAKIFRMRLEQDAEAVKSARWILKGRKTNVWGVRTTRSEEFDLPKSLDADDQPF